MSVRSFPGSVSSARWTRNERQASSLSSSGLGSGEAASGSSAGGSRRARQRSVIALRATVNSQAEPGPRSGR